MYKSPVLPKPVSEYDLRLLRVFRTVVQCEGFSAAESELNLSRSTISVHMGNLEQRLGLKLCNRGRAGFSLTGAGQQIYDAATQLFASLDQFATAVATVAGEISGELVIQCSDDVSLSPHIRLPAVLGKLQKQQPKLHVVVDVNGINSIEQMLLKDQCHIGLFPSYRQIEGLQYQSVYRQPLYLYCGASHPLFEMAEERIQDQAVQRYPVVYPGVEVNARGREQLSQLNRAARAYHFDARMALVQSGGYLGFFPADYAAPWLAKGKLRAVQPHKRFYDVEYSLVTRQAAKEQNKVSAFLAIWQALHS
ncbi:LysR family transcriptional regulator [Aliiglaciecola sp. CAU 1673]|uniref:LysR family transcriptional regulator n=1 Tax=Aliiglaciecola sp. CAU 1673 TaxID=3032595 RepID=UPI0023DB962A|nr:LysR family transcriptional regulator [Aliiglaciecola sp. CAU 1673]MDF2179045.1 LysR family transcriptional regulator [Aliiglaciecola sp. CAU 1673]